MMKNGHLLKMIKQLLIFIKMKRKLFFCPCIWLIWFNISTTNVIYFDYVEAVPLYLKDYFNISELRISKFNRTTFVANFRVDLYNDVDREYEIEETLHYNRLNNNQYNKIPFGISRTNLCDAMDKFYGKYLMKDVKNDSNFPQYKPPAKGCPIKNVRRKI